MRINDQESTNGVQDDDRCMHVGCRNNATVGFTLPERSPPVVWLCFPCWESACDCPSLRDAVRRMLPCS